MKIILAILALTFALQSFSEVRSNPPSFGSMGIPKKLFGIYPRGQIEDATAFPFRTIGQTEAGCTATLIGPKYIITAGHCVYDFLEKTWENNLKFYPGRTSETVFSYGVIGWKKVFIQKEYLQTGDVEFDFAVIELEEAIGDIVGWSGFKIFPQYKTTDTVRITGYPGDKEMGTMWSVTCPFTVDGPRIYYKCDTFNGMSGSAIFSMNPDPAQTYITAIHTWGSVETNGGVILGFKNFQLIHSWINDSGYSENTVIHEKKAGNTREFVLGFI